MNNEVAIVYWSGTGNTEAMAKLVASGVAKAGGSSRLFTADSFDSSMVASYSKIALGCPAMGVESLEDSVFQPMYDSIRTSLSGKVVGLFGSYGWGDGEWMRNWQEDVVAAGAKLATEPVTVLGSAEGDDAEVCVGLSKALCSD